LDLGVLASIQFSQTEQSASDELLGFVTISGDVLEGQLVDVTDDEFVVSGRRHGQFTIPRSAVRSFRHRNNPGLMSVSSTGKDGWSTLSRARRISEWTTNAEGQLLSKVVGAELFRDLRLPPVAEIDIALRWSQRPGFLITFARPNDTRLSKETVKLETWDDELVLQTLASDGNFEQLLTLMPITKLIRLRLIWSQPTGELSVFNRHGRLLGKMASTHDGGRGRSGLYIQNKGSDLTLVHVRVSDWKGEAPLELAAGQCCVQLVNGNIVYGELQGFDKSAQSLIMAGPSGEPKSIAVDQLVSVELGNETAKPDDTPHVQLTYHDGTLVRGTLDSIEGDTITLKPTYGGQLLTARLAGASELKFNAMESGADQRASDLLVVSGAKLHGTLAPAGPSGSALGWKPVGAADAVPLHAAGPARIVRDVKETSPSAPKVEFTDVIYLYSGDVFPCHIESIDETHVQLDTIFSAGLRVPHAQVKAVEFNTKVFLPASGFEGRGWVVTQREKDAVERTDGKVIFRGPATLGHDDLMWGDEIQFDLHWNQNAPAAMTMSLFARGATRSSAPGLLVYFAGQQMVVRGLQAAGGRAQAVMRQHMFQNNHAKLTLSLKDQQLQVFVDQKPVFSQPLNRRDQAGKGIVFTVQRLGGPRPQQIRGGRLFPELQRDMLTISSFRLGRSGGLAGTVQIDQEKKNLVLTVPRNRKKDPPAHVLVAQNGDLLRGKLEKLDQHGVQFSSRLDNFTFTRDRVAGIVWLDDHADDGDQNLEQIDDAVQATFTNGATFTFTAHQMDRDKIIGQHPLLGSCSVPFDALRELLLGDEVERRSTLAYADWKLRPAEEPKFVEVPAGGNGQFGMDSPLVGTPAPDFVTELVDGKMFRLSDHSDKIVILDFWATWCGPCVKAMPQIMETVESYPADQVVLVAVNQLENGRTIEEFLTARGWQLTVAMDRDGGIGQKFQVEAIPQTVIIGSGGKIERLHVGAAADLGDELKKVLQELITQPSQAQAANEGAQTRN
jgi:thiol-disulfide isomerase/thioredoxin